jgi:hypothetical protein
MDPREAAETSAGWGGDRSVLITSGDRAALAWRLRFDSGSKSKDERAERAYRTLSRNLERTLGPGKAHTTSFACWERPDRGPMAITKYVADIVLTAGPANAGSTGWTSAGDCAIARAWAREIVGSQ